MQFDKITIIGLGLIGGSLALALKSSEQVKLITGVDRDADSVDTALQKGIIDEGQVSAQGLSGDSDIVVIATHVGSIVDVAGSLNVSSKAVVTDTGSVKAGIVKEIEGSCDFSFVGSHPIAGTEKSGVNNIVEGLFENKLTIITPTENAGAKDMDKITSMWQLAGSKVINMSADRHDEIFARVSHLPHVAAFSLINSLLQKDSSLFNYGGGGLRDFSRIAESSPDMWADIFIANKEEILKAIDEFRDSLNQIEHSIESNDKKNLKKILSRVSKIKKS
ncbi:MAG: prephenate dehydrogenase/arogenate dehydrogenase family protein [Candidatus Dadabacteria bacterium]|nr:prephenate dehydrogenase/arogenate dehydrogenase family protein [Candidatus Dadabacteria bacterium]NIS07950.1 prephenate dehydrogenase/arogenate dehydrogenase family protein [Candidatus Dadabacteria bacterium]NIV43043.1 prephenate dehydrogenase/arogenate dehydrogenase family protein [Candidatus Dadabacteria bacterium]NIX14906.1 prephenate dehydrogenase/arogenate dehydrogenase family protein [Candidatus Dadabacteria bacterium]NIY21534.1 prephenate dehydrogenase/arogenate dehydrogenase family 